MPFHRTEDFRREILLRLANTVLALAPVAIDQTLSLHHLSTTSQTPSSEASTWTADEQEVITNFLHNIESSGASDGNFNAAYFQALTDHLHEVQEHYADADEASVEPALTISQSRSQLMGTSGSKADILLMVINALNNSTSTIATQLNNDRLGLPAVMMKRLSQIIEETAGLTEAEGHPDRVLRKTRE
ncbi:hypothetical protein P691DRAFT_774280 [Macrolepiota fuliginosa MF-IS2]|uniref:Uncharacterized protein n=1 Tax=Macrolepiota fuliginosa MF-IS2 TaxID=1400762 RepID=A0A9P5XFE1_9AGAR|nr:hypothetical protein P691DRAFT_774280 [Macrolepiota fuliginosa MF-IS2]